MNLQKTILHNGLEVLNIQKENALTATVLILVQAGSEYETKDKNGLSHFLEHMCFKGTKKRPNSKIISEELEFLGGQFNAFTSNNYTGYFAKASAEDADHILDIISDIYQNSIYEEKEIIKERSVIYEEINMYEDLPQQKAIDLLNRLMYGDQPAGWPILGARPTLDSIKRSDFSNYLRSHYIAQKTLVVVAGPQSLDEILPKIKKYFSKIKTGKILSKIRTTERQSAPGFMTYNKNTDQTHLVIGVRTAAINEHKIRPALYVLQNILGGGMSSRMFQNLREKHGLCYYAYAACEFYVDRGVLSLHSGVDNHRADLAMKIIFNDLRKIRNKGVSPKEFSRAKEHLKNHLILDLETSDRLAFFFGLEETLSKKVQRLEDVLKGIDAIQLSDIKFLAQKFFRLERINVAVVGPPDNKCHEKLIKIINEPL